MTGDEEHCSRVLQERIAEAESLLGEIDVVFPGVPGVAKLRHKIRSELRFLTEVGMTRESKEREDIVI